MTVEEAEAALGAQLPQRGLEGDFECEQLNINGDVNSDLVFTAEEGIITRVSFYTTTGGGDRSIRTIEGVGLGDDAAAVRRAYGARVQEVAIPMVDLPDLYVWSSPDRGVRFELTMDGTIWVMHAGAATIRNEGCLSE